MHRLTNTDSLLPEMQHSGRSEPSEANPNDLLTPKKIFFTSGTGRHRDPLVSFELALRDAGIHKFNLVPVSSIYPPGCEMVDLESGLNTLNPGQILFCVIARKTSSEQGKKIFASIGTAVPEDDIHHGYISEYSGDCNEGGGEDEEGHYSEKMAAEMLETAYGIKPARTFNITEKAEVRDNTTVVAAAVLVL
ncbi:MAG: arginine decarboxylase, pyruvoyl-dependent [Archaeoglobaceae archaeon]